MEGGAVCGRVAHNHAPTEGASRTRVAASTGSWCLLLTAGWQKETWENVTSVYGIQFLRAKIVTMSQEQGSLRVKGFEKLLAGA